MTLFEIAARHMDGPFEWGVRDCATSACGAFHEATGVDVLAQWRGRWRGPISAARMIRRAGGFEAMAASAGLVPSDTGLAVHEGALMFSIGPGFWAGKGGVGMVIVRRELRGWSWCSF